jgi:hypothetical protein
LVFFFIFLEIFLGRICFCAEGVQDVNKAFLQLFVALIKLVQKLSFTALEMEFTDGIEYTVKETVFVCEW